MMMPAIPLTTSRQRHTTRKASFQIDATTQDINEEVLIAIQNEHDIDPAYIKSLCQDFLNAVQALEDQAAAIHRGPRQQPIGRPGITPQLPC